MSDITPEMALAIATYARCFEPPLLMDAATAIFREISPKHREWSIARARSILRGLTILGFDVRVRSRECRICGDMEEHLGSNLCGRGHSKEWLKEKNNE